MINITFNFKLIFIAMTMHRTDASTADQLLGAFARVASAQKDHIGYPCASRHR